MVAYFPASPQDATPAWERICGVQELVACRIEDSRYQIGIRQLFCCFLSIPNHFNVQSFAFPPYPFQLLLYLIRTLSPFGYLFYLYPISSYFVISS